MQNEKKPDKKKERKPSHPWPKERRVLGKKHNRLDGPEKATGRAKYSADMNRPGMLHAVLLRSPHAHAKIVKIDTAAAEKMPGVKAIFLILQPGAEVYFAGHEIAALAADTEEQARDAVRAINVEFQELPFLVDEEDARQSKTRTVPGPGANNLTKPKGVTKGDVAMGFAEAEVIHEANYGVNTICHQCLEPHGLVAEWDADGKGLTVWASTQAVYGTARQLADRFMLPYPKVRCITHHMGGGYGSKFGPDIQGFAAAELAKKAGKPVKLMFDREGEVIAGGNRPSAFGIVKVGAKKDGSITAFEVSCYGTPGFTGGATVNLDLLPYIYRDAIPHVKREAMAVFTNAGAARALRAPGQPQNCLITDAAIDDLAAKLGLDPLIVRRKNLPADDPKIAAANPTAWMGLRHKLHSTQLDIVTQECNWKEKWHAPGQGPKKGPWRHGIGMAMHTWTGQAAGGAPNECTVKIGANGVVTAEASTQDLGTAQRTLTALVVAEILGVEPTEVEVRIGESQYGVSSGSGGSTTAPSQAPAALQAATEARNDLFAKVAPRLKVDAADLSIEAGKVVDSKSKQSWKWKEFCARLGMDEAKGVGEWSQDLANDPKNANISNAQVGGVQVAEVWVDVEKGIVRCTDFWAIQDCGMLINRLACESQVAGGVIMGINYALYEERIMDRHTGRQTNPDMEFYKLGGIQDMPKIHVHMQDMPERGVIGIGEPPTVSTAAAIGNAIHNAIGARVHMAPFTPQRIIAALEKGVKA